MALIAGSRLGPYEILAPLGAGGMGEVYRGRDTRLERTVAIKVLPTHLSSSEDVRRRFDREAKTVSALSHPHICAIYDVGHHDGVDYLVMEFLQGETLADRLAKGPLPLEQVLRYGIQIADALDKAHRQGIVHRDLKPSNVMLTATGVKLVDFGLAKIIAPIPSGGSLSILPTQAGENLTAEGTILGTFQYMAPEQLEGADADARTDIFALGSLLYEMATGKKAFSGRTQASLIGAILRDEPPPISTVTQMSPPALDRVVRTCLAKNPEDRFQTAHDVKLELQWIAEAGSGAGVPVPVAARRKNRERLAWALAAVALLAALAGAGGTLFYARRARSASRAVRSSILPPETWSFIADGSVAVSPDGRQLAYVAMSPERKTLLWVRPLDAVNARPLPDTDGAQFPFWSPDSRSIGFFSGGKLKRVDAAGGSSQTICDTPIGRGGTWNRDGVILFAPRNRSVIHRVSAAGGEPKPVTRFNVARKEGSHRWPFFLPDGRHFLFLTLGGGRAPGRLGQLFVGSLDSAEPSFLFDVNSNAAFARPGYLFFERESNLYAQRFEPSRLAVRGEPFLVADQVAMGTDIFHADFSVSPDGVLAYKNSALSPSKLVWRDRAGNELATVGEPAYYRSPRLAPDGRRASVIRLDPRTQLGDIWICATDRESASRFTFQPATYRGQAWSPDGEDLVYGSLAALSRKKTRSTGNEEQLLGGMGLKRAADWSPDGRYLLVDLLGAETGWDIVVLPVSGDKKPVPFAATSFNELDGRFSPDGKRVAYTSDESGRYEVYVRPFSGPGGAVRVSTEGGRSPAWTRGGSEIVYLGLDLRLMSVAVQPGPRWEVGSPRPLFQLRNVEDFIFGAPYDVTPDGQRFLVVSAVAEKTVSPITLVLNWTPESTP